jgi:hypothetical protein
MQVVVVDLDLDRRGTNHDRRRSTTGSSRALKVAASAGFDFGSIVTASSTHLGVLSSRFMTVYCFHFD